MEEDIKILEEMFEYNSAIEMCLSKEQRQAIENLINRNKELEEKRKTTMEVISANYIHKDKVREQIEELEKQMEKDEVDDFGIHSIGWSALDYIVDYLRKELLQEGDDKYEQMQKL